MSDISVKALQDVNITIEKGEFVSIIGQSGSGKSNTYNEGFPCGLFAVSLTAIA
ncbi:MAG: ATP-binding cassette domain-containing protein [Alkaliphilus sp.]